MTPKEKAEELVFKTFGCKKHYAKLAVDEILSFIEDDRDGFNWKTYYKEVKKEIEKL